MFDILTQRLALRGHSHPLVTRPRPVAPVARRVSVVVPCYNYGHFLPTAVASALDQPGVEVEVLVIDDASPDGSGEVASRLAASDPRVDVIRHERNAGHIATYNEGLARVKGDFTVLLSADDMLAPGALARAVALMTAHPSVGLVYGPAVRFATEPPPPSADASAGESAKLTWTVWRGHDWLEERCRMGRNVIRCPEVVMRTDVLRAVGDYRVDLPHGADFAMWMDAARLADIGRVGGLPAAFYRIHGANMSRTTYAVEQVSGFLVDARERRKCFEAVLVELPHLLELARRALAEQALMVAVRPYVWGVAAQFPVDELAAFAVETYPRARELPLWRALDRRRRTGPTRSRRNPLFVPTELRHRAEERAEAWRLTRAGV